MCPNTHDYVHFRHLVRNVRTRRGVGVLHRRFRGGKGGTKLGGVRGVLTPFGLNDVPRVPTTVAIGQTGRVLGSF